MIHAVLIQITVTLSMLPRSEQIDRINFGDGHNRTFVNDDPVNVLSGRLEPAGEIMLGVEPRHIPDLHQADAVQAGYSGLNGRTLILDVNDPLKLIGALQGVHSFTGDVGNQVGRSVLPHLQDVGFQALINAGGVDILFGHVPFSDSMLGHFPKPIGINFRPSMLSDRKSTRLNSSHVRISYAVFCLKKKKKKKNNEYSTYHNN